MSLFQEEFNSSKPVRNVYANPKKVKDMVKHLKDYIYIDVVSEPDGKNMSLLGVLFNVLMQYMQVKGGPISNLNFDYIDSIIGQNSGFDADKLFIEQPPAELAQPMIDPATGQPIPGAPTGAPSGAGYQSQPGMVQLPKLPQNNILAKSA